MLTDDRQRDKHVKAYKISLQFCERKWEEYVQDELCHEISASIAPSVKFQSINVFGLAVCRLHRT
jgi:hypothetical protein